MGTETQIDKLSKKKKKTAAEIKPDRQISISLPVR